MKPEKIKQLNDIIKDYNQFKESQLWRDISTVLKCGLDKAEQLADTHCNMVSFWACCKVKELLNMSYADFFKECLTHNYCNADGYIRIDKDDLLKHFGKHFELNYIEDYNNILNPENLNPDSLYQIKIKGHYMACYIENGALKLSDTSKRGIGQLASNWIEPDKFIWLLEI